MERGVAVVQSVVNDFRKVVSVSIQSSLQASSADVFRPPLVSNVEGSLRVSAGPGSADRLELIVTIVTGSVAWRDAAGSTTKAFRLTRGEDWLTAAFEIAVDAPGLRVQPTQASFELSTSGTSRECSFSVIGNQMDEMPHMGDAVLIRTIRAGHQVDSQAQGHDDGHG